jgi:KTSC domain-containing protein
MLHADGMERIAVASRCVSAIGYDPATFELEVAFRSGRTYRYQLVPVAAYRLLLRAPSIGEFVNKQITPRFAAKEV